MKHLGYGKGYVYDPETTEGFSGQDYFPEGVERPAVLTSRRARPPRPASRNASNAGHRFGARRAAGELLIEPVRRFFRRRVLFGDPSFEGLPTLCEQGDEPLDPSASASLFRITR